MQENFERGYKKELDRVRLTEESRQELTASLSRRQPGRRTAVRRRLPARRIITVAAAVCLLAALSMAGVAQSNVSPTLGNFFTGDQAGYDQSSGVIGRTVENDGWTITVTDCAGDDYQGFLGIEVEAPEGTALDAEYYEIYVDNEYYVNVSHSWNGFFYSLPDDDPTDNKIHMIYDWSARGEANHLSMRLRLVDLTENRGYLWDEHNWDRPMVKEGEWNFGWIDIDYEDNAIRLAPMVELPCEKDLTSAGVEKLILEEVVISPVGLYFRTNISLPYPVELEDWFAENMLGTVRLLDTSGNDILLSEHPSFYGLSGTYISFTDGSNAMNSASSEGGAELELVDLDRIESVCVAGITIPVR